MAALGNLLRYITPTNAVASFHLQHRRITVRHGLLALGLSAILSTLYYAYLRDDVLFRSDDVSFWSPETPQIWAERAAQVREAFRHAYRGYEHHAFPHDELLPVSNGSSD
jgi:hypothetical protein